MAHIAGTSLTLTDTLVDTSALRLDGVVGVATQEVGGTTYVYATANIEDAIQIMSLSSAGQLTPVNIIEDTSTNNFYDGAFAIESFTIDGIPFLMTSHLDSGRFYVFRNETGFAPVVETYATIFEGYDIEVLDNDTEGVARLVVTDYSLDRLESFVLYETGGSGRASYPDSSSAALDGAAGLTTFDVNGTHYLAVAAQDEGGIGIYTQAGSGAALSNLGTFFPTGDEALNGPRFLTSHVVGDVAYLFVPELSGDEISVISVTFPPTTAPQFEVVQQLGSSALTDVALDAEIIEIGDRVFLALTAFGSDLMQLFEVNTDPFSAEVGQLTHVETFADGTGVGALDGVYTAEGVMVDGAHFLLVTARGSDAVNVYEIGGGDDALVGTSRADLMTGASGDDTLQGRAGDDTLEGGNDVDVLEGGSGNDLIRGQDGSDRGWGGSGADTMAGGDGEDTFRGSDGDDRIFGGNDADVVAGNGGEDYLRGGNGDDGVFGGTGDDDLGGDAGNDTVEAGLGNDLARGGDDDDVISGNRGADTLVGNDGDDTLQGGADNDRLIGGSGRDVQTGGSGADTFVFANVSHSVHGSTRDTITDFAAGTDTIDLSGFAGTLSFVSSYSGAGNEVRYNDAVGRLYIDTDGDGGSDFSIDVGAGAGLTVDDLILS